MFKKFKLGRSSGIFKFFGVTLAGLLVLVAINGCDEISNSGLEDSYTTSDDADVSVTIDDDALTTSINKTIDYFVKVQDPEEGFWEGHFETDCSITADFILLSHYLGKVDTVREQKAVNYILQHQNSDGGWPAWLSGPSELDIAVVCYFALKLAGVSADSNEMLKAKVFILANGGADDIHILTTYKLAQFGQVPFSYMLPVSTICLMPGLRNIIFSMGYFSSVMVPVMIMYENHYICEVPEEQGIQELFDTDPWKLGFDYTPIKAGWRNWALEWLLERQEEDGNWAGVFQNSFFTLMALHGMEKPELQSVIDKGFEGVIGFQNETETTVNQQFSISPVMDTAYVIRALNEAGMSSSDPVITRAVDYLISKQSLIYADWVYTNPKGEPGGWGFEHYNQWYPDVDCTVMVLDAFATLDDDVKNTPVMVDAMEKGLNWVVSMQNLNGGFSAWNKDPIPLFYLVTEILGQPWSTYDGSVPGATSRVLLPFNRMGYDNDKVINRTINYLKRQQHKDGYWDGRYAPNGLYGTGQVLQGLAEIGEDINQDYIQEAIAWIKSKQNADGGWGETPAAHDSSALNGIGPSTAWHTTYVLIGLISAGEVDSPAVTKGIQYLLDMQLEDGSWDNADFYGCNVVGFWYADYEMLPTYKALHALALYRNMKN